MNGVFDGALYTADKLIFSRKILMKVGILSSYNVPALTGHGTAVYCKSCRSLQTATVAVGSGLKAYVRRVEGPSGGFNRTRRNDPE
jgi:hypothetical protein